MKILQSRAIRTTLACCCLAVAALAVGLQLDAAPLNAPAARPDRYGEFSGTIAGRISINGESYYLVFLPRRGQIVATGAAGLASGDEVLVRYRRGERFGLIVVRTHYVLHR